jgi:uncharacterized protein (DUF1697 family)
MYRFVAFLRGINVGGRSVKKETLRGAFESLGFVNVSTFKQSGNVVFEASIASTEEIKSRIESKLHEALGYEVAVFIRTVAQLQEIIISDPFRGLSVEGTSFLVTFLSCELSVFPIQLPVTIPKSTAQVISATGTEVFSVTHGGGEGALPNPFLESKLKVKATTRNLNVIRAIVEKYA